MSPILSNSWFAGFVESDGYFGVKISSILPKSETRKRSRSESIQILFRLNQRAFDAPNNTTMRPIMEILLIFFYKLELIALIILKKFGVLNCSLLSHKYKTLNPDISKEALSVTVTSLQI